MVEERLARWQRAAEIEKWKQSFSRLDTAEEALPAAGEIDLRLMIEDRVARLQWRPPGQPEFEPFRQQQYRQLEIDYRGGRVNFTTEGEILWQLFTSAVLHGMKLDLNSYDSGVTRVIGRILRTRVLQDRVVDRDGKPLSRFAEPLRWEVSPPETRDGDYRFRLLQNDGSPPTNLLCVIPGRPVLYLTSTGVFPGPACGENTLNPEGENLVPAPAVESADGVAFFGRAWGGLPARLKDRVRKLPWQISISCALQEIYPGSDTDECAVTVKARAEDGHEQTWDGFGWTAKNGLRRKSKAKDAAITIYDPVALNRVPALLQPLNLKPSRYSNKPVMRLTKRFADIFVAWLQTVPPDIQVHLDGELASLTSGDVVGRVKLEVTEGEIDGLTCGCVLGRDGHHAQR